MAAATLGPASVEMWRLVLLLLVPGGLSARGPEVKLGHGGALRGTYQTTLKGRKIAAFLGVPYAKTPARFQVAEPAEGWKGIREAVSLKPDCLSFSEIDYQTHGSEDCLYANVYTPEIPENAQDDESHICDNNSEDCLQKQIHSNEDSKLLDTVIYIHGGGFSFKIGDFGPKYILDQNVVFVFFSYRMGPLGFLSTGDEVLPGNLGLKDQWRLLQWVSKNIRYFGGNPDRVLLSGTSAGGASVHYHMLSPLSRGLFHRGFSMSGSALCCWTQAENSEEKAKYIARNLGCPTGSSQQMVNCLKEKDGHAIAAQMSSLQEWGYYPFTPLGPVVEPESPTAFITKYPSEIIRDGESMDIPWLTTVTSEEGLYPVADFIANKTTMDRLNKHWNELLPSLLDFEYTTTIFSPENVSKKIRKKYIGKGSVEDNLSGFIKMASDRLFKYCVAEAAKLHAERYKSPVYSYVFSYRGTHSGTEFLSKTDNDYGVCHGDDTGYIFENKVVLVEDSERDREMIGVMTELVSNFASTGKPSMKGVRNWPRVGDFNEFTYLNIRDPETFETVSNSKFGQPEFWNSLKFAED